jgi:CheY-like chemotaxis protein
MDILVVDDEKAIASLFQQRFKNEIKDKLYRFHYVQSSEAALEYLADSEAHPVILVLSDIEMEGMNGLELLKHVKRLYPNIPVFIVTAYDDEYNLQKALSYGADDFITKPIDFDHLEKKIEGFFRFSQPRTENA